MKNLKQKFDHASYRSKILGIMSISILIFSNTGIAQDSKRWSLNLRPSANYTTNKFGDATLNFGYGAEGIIAYWFIPKLSIYAGWGWNKFQAEKSFAGSNIDVVETGYRAGLQFRCPIGSSKIQYLLAGGALFNHIEIENEGGNIVGDSGHGLGWQAESGIVIPLGERFSLTPTVRYQSLMREINIGMINTPVDLNYVSGGISLSFLF